MTTRTRASLLTSLWSAGLGGSVVLLVRLGAGALAAPPVADPDRLRAWLESRDTVTAAFAVVRLGLLMLAGYLVFTSALSAIARVTRSVHLLRLAEVSTVPAVRRLLGGIAGVGLSASTATMAVATSTPVRDGGSEVVEPDQPGPRLVIERLDEGSTIVLERLEDDGEGTATMRVVPAEAPAAPPVPALEWVAAAGDSMWEQAVSVLAEAWGRAPSDAEVVPYWQALVEANRHRLADRSNPSLIFVGQAFTVPPPPPAP
jgi:hypothetical protein